MGITFLVLLERFWPTALNSSIVSTQPNRGEMGEDGSFSYECCKAWSPKELQEGAPNLTQGWGIPEGRGTREERAASPQAERRPGGLQGFRASTCPGNRFQEAFGILRGHKMAPVEIQFSIKMYALFVKHPRFTRNGGRNDVISELCQSNLRSWRLINSLKD